MNTFTCTSHHHVTHYICFCCLSLTSTVASVQILPFSRKSQTLDEAAQETTSLHVSGPQSADMNVFPLIGLRSPTVPILYSKVQPASLLPRIRIYGQMCHKLYEVIRIERYELARAGS